MDNNKKGKKIEVSSATVKAILGLENDSVDEIITVDPVKREVSRDSIRSLLGLKKDTENPDIQIKLDPITLKKFDIISSSVSFNTMPISVGDAIEFKLEGTTNGFEIKSIEETIKSIKGGNDHEKKEESNG